MAKFKNVQDALQAIDDDAEERAWERAWSYLEREAPKTAAAIQYLVVAAGWSKRQIMDHFEEAEEAEEAEAAEAAYGDTEKEMRYKIKLVVEALVKERDGG